MAIAVLAFAEQASSKEIATFATAATAALTSLRTFMASTRGSRQGSSTAIT
jgi:hypothetical protein